jgi:hypothetical protein
MTKREALKKVEELILDEAKWADDMSNQQAIALGVIQTALAEPIKNCEVGTIEEQQARFIKMCVKHYRSSIKCPNCPFAEHKENSLCELAWAQAPYTEGTTNDKD